MADIPGHSEYLNSRERLRKIVLLFSEKQALSPSQVSFILGIDPTLSVSLVQVLIDKGLIDGSDGVAWNKLCSLSTKGILLAQSIEKEEELI